MAVAVVRTLLLIALCLSIAPRPSRALDLEAGLALTDPETMQALEAKGYSLNALFDRAWTRGAATTTASTKTLADTRGFRPLFTSLARDIAGYKPKSVRSPSRVFLAGSVFDQRFLKANYARFELVGVINRIDRRWRSPAASDCGEVRFIYRLAYKGRTVEGEIMSRLPMTFNLVLRQSDSAQTAPCADMARRWLASGAKQKDVAWLLGPESPLALVDPRAQIDRIEMNLQIMRWRASEATEFGGHAEYLLRIFKWNPTTQAFSDGTLENQVDRAKLAAPEQLAAFKAWLLAPDNFRKLDDGTLLIEERLLATSALSVAPGGASRSRNRPFDGLQAGQGRLASDDEIDAAIKRAESAGGKLLNISSAAGFQRRLNDMTCIGCHQSRAIGGFHFMGADRKEIREKMQPNAIFVPASAHFYGEAPRRLKIVKDIAAGTAPNYARGFSARPRRSMARIFEGQNSGFFDGWGAACYIKADDLSAVRDKSFAAWGCGKGLTCVQPHVGDDDDGIGLCTTQGRPQIGDPLEFGVVRMQSSYGFDTYQRIKPKPEIAYPLDRPHVNIKSKAPDFEFAAHQGYDPNTSRGGFFGGMLRTTGCRGPALSKAFAICNKIASTGFNTCLQQGHNFSICMQKSEPSILRKCNREMPCRDDYICTTSTSDKTQGACLPPYFLFQFRVDGHPKNFLP